MLSLTIQTGIRNRCNSNVSNFKRLSIITEDSAPRLREGLPVEWMRYERNPKMLNRMIKDEARSLKRHASRGGSVDQERLRKILTTTEFLSSSGDIDQPGWDALVSLSHWFKERSEQLLDLADESDGEDQHLITDVATYSGLSLRIIEAMMGQAEAKEGA